MPNDVSLVNISEQFVFSKFLGPGKVFTLPTANLVCSFCYNQINSFWGFELRFLAFYAYNLGLTFQCIRLAYKYLR